MQGGPGGRELQAAPTMPLPGSMTAKVGGDTLSGSPQSGSTSSSCRLGSHDSDQLGPLLCTGKPPPVITTHGQGSQGDGSEPGELSPNAKLFVFILFTQLMQALMSYDGGATQMSTQPLLASGWSSSELGFLGAMDKFGQVATAFIWSKLLMKYNIKALLAMGLFAKAGSCLGFGILESKSAMLLAKLGMGVSEALIGVWATVWVQANAPKDSQARWLGFASISAGTGNGAGSAVAGLCSKSYGYAFAFVVQACILFALWGIMLLSPARFFEFEAAAAAKSDDAHPSTPEHRLQSMNTMESMSSVTTDHSDCETAREGSSVRRNIRSASGDLRMFLREEIATSMTNSASKRKRSIASDWHTEVGDIITEEENEDGGLSIWATLTIVLGSRLWFCTAMAISLSCFITSAIAYMWQNTTSSVWRFNDKEATYSFLVTTGLGGMVGVALGPKLFDEYLGGFSDLAGVYRCLKWCITLIAAAVVFGTISALLFLDTAWHMVHYEVARQARGCILGCVLAGIFCVFALVNSMQGTLYGINTDSTTPETKTSAAALTVSLQNVVGFALGPLLPSVVAEYVGDGIQSWTPEAGPDVARSAQFACGMAVSLLALWPLLLSLHLGASGAGPAGGDERPMSAGRLTQMLVRAEPMRFMRSDGPLLEFAPL
mmetsp:Transcript_98113/g.282020  ORF Transcript_98113/g.282020 Transcript_98113/m.282020 type:complete len:660 (+) Transcript_98113:182-2161(+)